MRLGDSVEKMSRALAKRESLEKILLIAATAIGALGYKAIYELEKPVTDRTPEEVGAVLKAGAKGLEAFESFFNRGTTDKEIKKRGEEFDAGMERVLSEW